MKNSFRNTKILVIGGLIVGLLTIVLVIFTVIRNGNHDDTAADLSASPSPPGMAEENAADTVLPADSLTSTVLVIFVDQSEHTITFYDPNTDTAFLLTYTDSTSIKNKYGKIMTAAQLLTGDIADLYYSADATQLYQLQLSDDYWEYDGVVSPDINTDKNILNINDINYRCSNEVIIVSNDSIYSLADLYTIDKVNIRGVGERVYVMDVINGHGALSFINEDEYVGGSLYLNEDFAGQITQDMTVYLPEGTYDVTITNGDLSGSKTVTIDRYGTTVFDASEYSAPIYDTGIVDFSIFPEGADLYIDDTYEFFQTNLSLTYGEHIVEVSLGGYVTWTGTIEVSKDHSSIQISLAEGTAVTDDGQVIDTTGDTVETTPTAVPSEATDTGEDSTSDDTVTEPEDSSSDSSDDETQNSSDDSDSSDSDGNSDDSGTDTTADTDSSTTAKGVVIKWYASASVLIDDIYVGTTDSNGELTVDIAYGPHTIYLMINTVYGTYNIEVTSETTILSFPTSITADGLYSD